MIRSRGVRLALLALPLLMLAITVVIAGTPSDRAISLAVERAGPAAPITLVALYIGWTVLILPGSVLTVVGGALFGFGLGAGLTLVGADIGATAAYLIARRTGGQGTFRGGRAARLQRWLEGNGFAAILSARLMPGVPFNLLNYAAGVGGVPLRPYVGATALGIIPGTLLYAALGSSLTHRSQTGIVIGLYLMRAFAVVLIWALRRKRRNYMNPSVKCESLMPREGPS